MQRSGSRPAAMFVAAVIRSTADVQGTDNTFCSIAQTTTTAVHGMNCSISGVYVNTQATIDRVVFSLYGYGATATTTFDGSSAGLPLNISASRCL